jgi:ABC-type lipoprotein export system ATPase subunit
MAPLLEAQNLTKTHRAGTRFEVPALQDVSLCVSAGSAVGLTGASGSGKTTLLTLLGALDRPTSGRVLFHGRDLQNDSNAALTRIRQKIGFVFQDFALIPSLSVWENITYPLIPRGVFARERRKLAELLLEQLRIPAKLDEFPQSLSGGEQQRVAIARALAGQPEMILADEPTSNLDATSTREVVSLLKTAHAGGTTLILSSHDQQLMATVDTVYRLDSGRLISREEPSQRMS